MALNDEFYSEDNNLYHLKKPFTCSWPNCGLSFAFSEVFKLHLILHRGVKHLKLHKYYGSQVQEVPHNILNIKQEIDENHRNVDSGSRDSMNQIPDSYRSNFETNHDFSETGLLEEYGDYQITETTSEFGSQSFKCKEENIPENFITLEKNPNYTTGVHLDNRIKSCSNIERGNHTPEDTLNLKIHTAAYPSDENLENCIKSYDPDVIRNVEIMKSRLPKLNNIEKQIFVCDWKDCTKSYKSAKWLKQHRQNYHGANESKEYNYHPRWGNYICSCSNCMSDNPQSNIPKQHICDFDGCGKLFLAPFHLLNHARIHTDQRPFVCNFKNCSKSFRLAGMLKRHHLLHTGRKNYECLECGFKCVRSSNLAKHKKTHSQKQFICDFNGCTAQFSASSRLLAHAQTHIVERLFVCNFENCTQSFGRNDELEVHRGKHTNQKEYECPECGLKCIRLVYLAMHKKTHFG